MASAGLHFTVVPKNNLSSIAVLFVEHAPEALIVHEVSSDLLQHTDDSSSVVRKNEALSISSDIEETSLLKNSPGNQNNKLMQIDEELLKVEIRFLQCPFTWNLNSENTREKTVATCDEKLNIIENEKVDGEEEYEWWNRFILMLVLCHEHSIITNSSEALKKLQECENLISKCQSNDKPYVFFQNIKEAVLHVINASKCHLLVSLNMFNEAMELKKWITRYEDMNKQNMAAIFGIRSAMLMEYGYDGTKAALEYAEKAVSLDGNEGEWNLLYGKLLGRIRRVEKIAEIPTHEELSALEQAVAKTRNASRVIFLAQAYREAASRAFHKNKDNIDIIRDTINKMNEKSLQLYWEALKLNGNSANINTRCAAGLLKLPPPFQDLDKAEECIEKALKLGPNNTMTHHVAGMVYERLSKFDLAEKFYTKAGEGGAYGGYMDLLRMKFRRDRNYNPMPELERMLQQYRKTQQIQEIYLHMGSYHFYSRKDILSAIDYWRKGIEEDPNAEKLKVYLCTILNKKTAVNLYQVIADEIQLAFEQRIYTPEEIHKLRNMLLYCKERYPSLLTNKSRNWKEHSSKEQHFQGRNKNQNSGREGEYWRSNTQEELNSNYSTTSSDNRNKLQQLENWRYRPQNSSDLIQKVSGTSAFRNKDQSEFQKFENWRCRPKNSSDLVQVSGTSGYRNKNQSKFQQLENWRYQPRNSSESIENDDE